MLQRKADLGSGFTLLHMQVSPPTAGRTETPAKSWPPSASSPSQGAPKLGSSMHRGPPWTKPLLHSTSEEAWFYPIHYHIEYLWIYFLCAACDWKTSIWWNLRLFQAHSCKWNTQQTLDGSPHHTQDQTKLGMQCNPHCDPGTAIQRWRIPIQRMQAFKYHLFFSPSCMHLYFFLACLQFTQCLSSWNISHLAI